MKMKFSIKCIKTVYVCTYVVWGRPNFVCLLCIRMVLTNVFLYAFSVTAKIFLLQVMAAINKRNEPAQDYVGFNSGVMLSILKHNRVNSDVAQLVVQEWCKHVRLLLVTLWSLYANSNDFADIMWIGLMCKKKLSIVSFSFKFCHESHWNFSCVINVLGCFCPYFHCACAEQMFVNFQSKTLISLLESATLLRERYLGNWRKFLFCHFQPENPQYFYSQSVWLMT